MQGIDTFMKNNIKLARFQMGISQAELAKLLGVSRQTVISIEKDKYDPSLPLAFKLSKVLNMKIEEIFTEEE